MCVDDVGCERRNCIPRRTLPVAQEAEQRDFASERRANLLRHRACVGKRLPFGCRVAKASHRNPLNPVLGRQPGRGRRQHDHVGSAVGQGYGEPKNEGTCNVAARARKRVRDEEDAHVVDAVEPSVSARCASIVDQASQVALLGPEHRDLFAEQSRRKENAAEDH